MATKSVSNRNVKALRCPSGQGLRAFLWDQQAFGLRRGCLPLGKKTYVVQYFLNGRSHRMALGEHGRFLTPKGARSMAKKHLGRVEDGKDPIEERRKDRAVRTLKELAADFMQTHAKAKRKSSYSRRIRQPAASTHLARPGLPTTL